MTAPARQNLELRHTTKSVDEEVVLDPVMRLRERGGGWIGILE